MKPNFQPLEIVVGNQTDEGLPAEHGLVIWIEARDKIFLKAITHNPRKPKP